MGSVHSSVRLDTTGILRTAVLQVSDISSPLPDRRLKPPAVRAIPTRILPDRLSASLWILDTTPLPSEPFLTPVKPNVKQTTIVQTESKLPVPLDTPVLSVLPPPQPVPSTLILSPVPSEPMPMEQR